MELIERLPLKPIYWLSQLTYAEFVELCLNKNKKHTQLKSQKPSTQFYNNFVKLT